MFEIPENYSLLIYGPPGVGKYEFCLTLLDKIKDKAIFITTEISHEKILKDFGKNSKNIFIIDGYSWIIEEKIKVSKDNILYLSDLYYLDKILYAIEEGVKFLEATKVAVVLHSVSTLFLYNDESNVLKFLHKLILKIKDIYGRIILTMQEFVHKPQIYYTLMSFCDGVIHLRFEEKDFETKRYMKIRFLKGVKEYPLKDIEYKIERSRIVFI